MTEKEVKIDDEDMVSMSFSVNFKQKSQFWRSFLPTQTPKQKFIIVFSMCEFDIISNDLKNSKIWAYGTLILFFGWKTYL